MFPLMVDCLLSRFLLKASVIVFVLCDLNLWIRLFSSMAFCFLPSSNPKLSGSSLIRKLTTHTDNAQMATNAHWYSDRP